MATDTEENPSQIPQNSKAFKTSTLLQGLSDFLNISEPAAAFLLSLGAILAGIIGGYFWFESRISLAVEKRVEPYEDFLKGMILVHDQEYDRSVPHFRKSLQTLGARFAQEDPYNNSNVYPIVDYYLEAIVNSENPHEYEGDFDKIKKLFEENFSRTAWQHQQMGWYHFRTNNLEEAEANFKLAIEKYAADDVYYASGNSYWALSLIYLANENLAKAAEFYSGSLDREGRTYESTAATLNGMSEDWFFKEVWRLNPNIEKNRIAYLKIIKEIHDARMRAPEQLN
jgi:tetratricopeptide (TPR) repeat protein